MKRALALLPAVLLAGCGFQLVGERPLPQPLHSVYIDLVDPYHVSAPPLQQALMARITRGGGTVKSHEEDAETILRLSNLEEGRSVLSVGPDGRAIEYQLRTRVTYELRDKAGKELIPAESQNVTRDFSFSAQQVLPKDAEEQRLRGYIQDELAELVLLRVEARLLDRPGLAKLAEPPKPDALPLPATAPAVVPADAAGAPPAQ